jgi:hypothetical protein
MKTIGNTTRSWILDSSLRYFRDSPRQAGYDSTAIGRLRPRARREELAEVWTLLNLTRGEFKYIQHQVSSIVAVKTTVMQIPNMKR